MSRGRRKAVDDDGAVGDTKRQKLSPPELDGLQVRVDWEGDDGKWTSYDRASAVAICSSLNGKKKPIDVRCGAVPITIDVVKSVQKNKATGWERRIRLCFSDPAVSGQFVTWEWQDEKGRWQPFPIQACLDIQKVKDDGSATELDVTSGGRRYHVDLNVMEQTNANTSVKRKIRRVGADAQDATTSDTDAAPAQTSGAKPTSGKKAATAAMASGDADDEKPAARKSARTKVKSDDVTEKNAAKGSSADVKRKSGVKVKHDPEETKVRSVIVKGKAPVDPECTSKVSCAHVYCEGKDVYDVMLNQTNLQNNNNKYYLCQLLEDDTAGRYSVWFRWGRVGRPGQHSLLPCGADLQKAKNVFTQKFQDKTKNAWASRDSFVKVAGKYDLLHMDYGADNKAAGDDTSATKVKKQIPESKLDARIQTLIKLICDVRTMEYAVKEMKYDCKKAPLGKLTAAQIKAGYRALKLIDDCITAGSSGGKLLEACNDFYTRVPHDFGMSRPPLIRTKEEVKLKLTLLEALGDIQVAMTMLADDAGSDENPDDRHYKSLDCNLVPVDKSSDDYKVVEEYLQRTHAKTHNHYKMVLEDVFVCDKSSEREKFVDYGNRMLLWHGSRLTNWVSILKQGLRIAPPEAPVTGYMFGKGVYFSDMSSKSANYCFATKSKNAGLMLLCEVSLGKCRELLAADYTADQLPVGFHSVKGLGSVAPDPSDYKTLTDGTVVPIGQGKETGVDNPNGYTLNYNEFIVYSTDQIRMKYLCKIRMDFK